jgi:hypothetical protein
MFWNARTATEGLSGSGSGGVGKAGADGIWCPPLMSLTR